MIRVMAPGERDGARGLSVGVSRSPLGGTTVGGRACSIGAGMVGSARFGSARSACVGAVDSAVGAGVDVSRDDDGRLTRNVVVKRTTTTPIAALASERETRRGAAGRGSESV